MHKFVKQLKAFRNSNLTSIRNRNNVEPKILKKIPLCFKNMGTLKYYMKFLFSNSLIQKMTKLPLWRLKHLSSWVELEFQPRKSLFGWENIMRNFLLDSLLPYWGPLKQYLAQTHCVLFKFQNSVEFLWWLDRKICHFADSFQAGFFCQIENGSSFYLRFY